MQELTETLQRIAGTLETLAARIEKVEREHQEIAEALRTLDAALGGALELLKAHHKILKKAIDGEAAVKVSTNKQVLN